MPRERHPSHSRVLGHFRPLCSPFLSVCLASVREATSCIDADFGTASCGWSVVTSGDRKMKSHQIIHCGHDLTVTCAQQRTAKGLLNFETCRMGNSHKSAIADIGNLARLAAMRRSPAGGAPDRHISGSSNAGRDHGGCKSPRLCGNRRTDSVIREGPLAIGANGVSTETAAPWNVQRRPSGLRGAASDLAWRLGPVSRLRLHLLASVLPHRFRQRYLFRASLARRPIAAQSVRRKPCGQLENRHIHALQIQTKNSSAPDLRLRLDPTPPPNFYGN